MRSTASPGVHRSRFQTWVLLVVLTPAGLAACRGDRATPAGDTTAVTAAAPAPAAQPAPAAPAEPAPRDGSAPTTPQQLEAAVSPGAAALSWTRSSDDVGVEGYEVFRDSERIGRVADRELRDAGLRGGQRYCYTVVAFDAAGNRSEPSAATCVTAPDVAPPSAPGALASKLAAPTEIELRWPASADDVGVAGYEVLRGDRVVLTTRELSARLAGLAPARRHCHAVRAFDAAGNRSAATAPACVVTPDVTPPAAPPEVAASPKPGAIDLRWSAATDDVGVVGYEVLREGAVIASTKTTTATERGLRAGVRQCYTVRALDQAGNRSAPSAPVCAAPPDVTPPSIPANVAAKPEGETVLTLRWSASTDDVGVARYEILRDVTAVAKADATETKLFGLRAGAEYCHAVRACDAAGNCSAPSQPVCVKMPDLTPPVRVANVSAHPDSDRRVTVRWAATRDNVGVTRYEVRRAHAKALSPEGAETSITEEGLSPATRYCYVVVAEDAAGNVSQPSEPACAVTPDLVPPSMPEGVAVLPRSPAQLVLTWRRSSDDVGVAGYELVKGGAVTATFERTQGMVDGLTGDTEYCLSVRAFDAAGNRSTPSPATCTRTAKPSTPTAPTNLRAEPTTEALRLTWDPSPDPGVVYAVYWDRGRGGDALIGTTALETLNVFGKVASERHCYYVIARDESSRESPRTFPACGTVPGRRAASADVPAASSR